MFFFRTAEFSLVFRVFARLRPDFCSYRIVFESTFELVLPSCLSGFVSTESWLLDVCFLSRRIKSSV